MLGPDTMDKETTVALSQSLCGLLVTGTEKVEAHLSGAQLTGKRERVVSASNSAE